MNRDMSCKVYLWLLVSLGWTWGMGHEVTEMVLGTLGKTTTLRIPLEFQEQTRRSGVAAWKRGTENPQRKFILHRYSYGNATNYLEGQTCFHKSDFSLEIRNTSWQDRQLYEYIISEGPKELIWQVQLEVYEPVSNPTIEILSWALANGSCTFSLNCSVERGDRVSYSWGSQDSSTSALCSHNGSLLHLSYPTETENITCTCTASNPISSRVATFNSSKCSNGQAGSARLRTKHLVLMVVVPIVAVMMLTGVFMVARLAVPVAGQEHPSSLSLIVEDNGVHTIYSQVQRVEKQKGIPEHHPCTTIYAAATSLTPDKPLTPGRASQPPHRAPTEPPAQQDHPQSPDKEPTTVYASVTLPVA